MGKDNKFEALFCAFTTAKNPFHFCSIAAAFSSRSVLPTSAHTMVSSSATPFLFTTRPKKSAPLPFSPNQRRKKKVGGTFHASVIACRFRGGSSGGKVWYTIACYVVRTTVGGVASKIFSMSCIWSGKSAHPTPELQIF